MSTIQRSLFKKYDIRGRASGDDEPLTPAVAYAVGRAFGAHLAAAGVRAVVVGRDNRLSSEALAREAIRGLYESGCQVTDIGLVATPIVNWASVQSVPPAGAFMVTGSHLAADQNGFKLGIGAQSLYGDAIQDIYARIEAGDSAVSSAGALFQDPTAIARHCADLVPRVQAGGRRLRVVVDAGSGTAGLSAPALIRALGHELADCLYCEPDGTYPHHHPDPGDARNLRELAARVIALGADVGLAFDGDADRVGVVDEKGQPLAPDRVLALLAHDLLARRPGATVIADVSSSQVVFDEIAQAGGVPLMWMTGHSLVKAKMRETGALLGGEISGHIFMGEDYYGFDDAFLAAGRVLSLVARSGKALSALDAAMPRYVATPIMRPHCPPQLAERAIARIAADWAHLAEVSTVDGLRLRFAEGWGVVRASNTEPVLSMRLEGVDEAAVELLRARFIHSLSAFPEIDLHELMGES